MFYDIIVLDDTFCVIFLYSQAYRNVYNMIIYKHEQIERTLCIPVISITNNLIINLLCGPGEIKTLDLLAIRQLLY